MSTVVCGKATAIIWFFVKFHKMIGEVPYQQSELSVRFYLGNAVGGSNSIMFVRV